MELSKPENGDFLILPIFGAPVATRLDDPEIELKPVGPLDAATKKRHSATKRISELHLYLLHVQCRCTRILRYCPEA